MKACPLHPKYQGIHKPRLACEACWAVWFELEEGWDEVYRLRDSQRKVACRKLRRRNSKGV